MREYEKDVELLVEAVELLLKELRTIKRRKYYREKYNPNQNAIKDKVSESRFHLYAKVGRKWKGKSRKEVVFE